MKILGLDPGVGVIGYGVISSSKSVHKAVAHGIITTSKELSIPDRLAEIYADLNILLSKYKPDCAAVEKIFFKSNQKTIIEVSQARGVILLALKNQGINIFEYTPLQIKLALTGYGRATKSQMMQMTQLRLKLSRPPKPDDAADALAAALCHAGTAGSLLYNNRDE